VTSSTSPSSTAARARSPSAPRWGSSSDNLVGTKVTAKGIMEMKDLKSLKYLYLYKTAITPGEREQLKRSFPETMIDFGDYTVPTLAADTTEININVKE
jgi:hypothetical protein